VVGRNWATGFTGFTGFPPVPATLFDRLPREAVPPIVEPPCVFLVLPCRIAQRCRNGCCLVGTYTAFGRSPQSAPAILFWSGSKQSKATRAEAGTRPREGEALSRF
jgi:hypothetical protein